VAAQQYAQQIKPVLDPNRIADTGELGGLVSRPRMDHLARGSVN
jgi:hypothetical protein